MVVSGIWAMVAAISSTVASRSARGTTRLTMPQSSAWVALMVGARKRYSAARLKFMRTQGSIMVWAPGSPKPWGSGIWK